MLESRARYALVQGGIGAAIFCGIYILANFPEISVGRALRVAALALAIGVVAQGLIWYPRAKRKLTNPPRVS